MRPPKVLPADIELWRSKNGASAKTTAKVFGVSEMTVHRARRKVRDAVMNDKFDDLEFPERSDLENLKLSIERENAHLLEQMRQNAERMKKIDDLTNPNT